LHMKIDAKFYTEKATTAMLKRQTEKECFRAGIDAVINEPD
jgi:hypothetical protein